MKILVNCYACSPFKGSEPGMGWNFVSCLAKMHELHIITESKFQPDIEKYFCEHPDEQDYYNFYFIKKKRHKKLRKIWPPSYYWFYKAWQKKAYRRALELDEKEHFDVVHQLNMVGYREPGYLWKMHQPFVWGPIGGFGKVPWCLIPSMSLWGVIFYTCHNIINNWQMRMNWRVKAAMKKATYLIAATIDVQTAIHQLYGKDSVIIPEVGLIGNGECQISRRQPYEKLKICWSGLHIPRKSLNLLLDAIALDGNEKVELHVIGEGSETKRWKRKSKRLGLRNIVWHGWMSRDEGLRIMQSCHLFCITSLSDLTSTVILEALSFGLPVIALDHCGFGNVLTPSCGIKISINNKRQVVKDFNKAILDIEKDEDRRYLLAKGAQMRSKEFNWKDKAEVISKIYETVSV